LRIECDNQKSKNKFNILLFCYHEKIGKIKQQSEDREHALVESEKMLKYDYDNFQKYLDANK